MPTLVGVALAGQTVQSTEALANEAFLDDIDLGQKLSSLTWNFNLLSKKKDDSPQILIDNEMV